MSEACAGCHKRRQPALCERCAARTAYVTREPTGGQGLRFRIEKLAKQYERLSEELHLVPAADAFHDAALDLRRALDGEPQP